MQMQSELSLSPDPLFLDPLILRLINNEANQLIK